MRLYFSLCLFLALVGASGMALSLFYAPPPAPDSGEMPPAFGFSMLSLGLAAALGLGGLLVATLVRLIGRRR